MKKSIKFLCLVLSIVALIFTFVACNSDGDDIKAYSNIELTSDGYSFCVPETKSTLHGLLNAFIDDISNDGRLDSILNNYFGDGTPEGATSCESPREGKELSIAICTNSEPFAYKSSNTFYGIDVEIIKLYASENNYDLTFYTVADVNGVVDYIASNLSDIGIGAVAKTSERYENVNFTKVYYNASQIILAGSSDTTFDSCSSKDDILSKMEGFSFTRTIGYVSGSSANTYFDELKASEKYDIEGKGYVNPLSAAKALSQKDIQYVICDSQVANVIINQLNK